MASQNVEPIRVLHVVQRMEAGGTQAFLMNLYRNIDRKKVQFDFLVEYEEKQFYDDEVERLGGRIYRTTFREDCNLPRFVAYLKRFFREHPDYRIVHCHCYTIGYFVLKAAHEAGVAVRIAHSHSNSMSGLTKPLKMGMRWLFTVHANRLMACSAQAGRFLFGDRAFAVVKNAIDVDRFVFDTDERIATREEFCLGDSFVVGNVGRLHQQKNQAFLLDVFKEVLMLRSDAHLLLVGSGPLKEEILAKAVKLGVDGRLTLLSNRSDMNRLYQAMDVFVLPSLYEGLGMVAIEAQSAGLVTVCSDGVAEDADVSALFERLSLSASPKIWAETVVSAGSRRDSATGAAGAKICGFDVKENSAALQSWYLDEVAHVQ